MTDLIDKAARARALDIQHSFIVQAPAGSGKTELLTQRFLALLSQVERYPEQVLAITFTRKAAAEMRQRVFTCLQAAAQQPEPEAEHAKTTWRLAQAVLERDKQAQWGLMENPNRLSVQTIDALCASLTNRLPMMSRLGAKAKIVDDAQQCYQQAAAELFDALESELAWSASAHCLLQHLDNRLQQAIDLLAYMLSTRDQWLPLCVSATASQQLRADLEANLAALSLEKLQAFHAALCRQDRNELLCLANYAAKQCQLAAVNSPIEACADHQQLPAATLAHLSYYQGIATLLTSKEGQWRRAINKTCGFPAASSTTAKEQQQQRKRMKTRMLALLAHFNQDNDALVAVQEFKTLPPTEYSDRQWQLIAALLQLLPIAAANLALVFQQRGELDFIEVSLRALQALGTEEEPTDLALTLDYRYQHLLVDEFQDTSLNQWQLLERLTAGWSPEDGRTLFLVGDPMQSIYRFRQAEVGLFLRARQQGLGSVALQTLQLQANFRSQHGIISWCNRVLTTVFPQQENIAHGAVTYAPATAVDNNHGLGVSITPVEDSAEEAYQVVQLIEQLLAAQASSTIAVLVRSRSHLRAIVPALLQANIPYHAVDIDPLLSKEAVMDCLMLTRALLHDGDRIAWLAILRAPWCALSLQSLTVLTAKYPQQPIWLAMQNSELSMRLPTEQWQRLARVVKILTPLRGMREQQSWRALVETAWRQLGGEQCCRTVTDYADIKVYFQQLQRLQVQGPLPLGQALTHKFSHYYAQLGSNSEARVQIMTVHKSKGLEFDHVILPALERRSAQEEQQLLNWLEYPSERATAEWILAPIAANTAAVDAIYAYVRQQKRQQAQYELIRLLYVALTRAKKSLHLFASAKEDSEGELKPAPGSVLALLWPHIASEFKEKQRIKSLGVSTLEQATAEPTHKLWYLPSPQLPVVEEFAAVQSNNSSEARSYFWQAEAARQVGTVVHRHLYLLSQPEKKSWLQRSAAHWQPYWQRQLQQLGVINRLLPAALREISLAIETCLQSQVGQWLLQPHQQAASEYSVCAEVDGELLHGVMDRTFIDEQQQRWIIDYKMAKPLPEQSLADFLAKQRQLYHAQLQRYAKLFQRLQPQIATIRLALYFPLLNELTTMPPSPCRSSSPEGSGQIATI